MSVPAYAELPVIEALVLPHAWDVWGREDNLGTLNHLTPARVALAAAEIATGQRFALSLPSDLIDPPLFGRKPMTRDVFAGSRSLPRRRPLVVLPGRGAAPRPRLGRLGGQRHRVALTKPWGMSSLSTSEIRTYGASRGRQG